MTTDQITENQLRYLLILAWQRTGADEAEIEAYRTSFRGLTNLQAANLITTWNALPQLRNDDPPTALDAWVLTTAPATSSTNDLAFRHMNARFQSNCAACGVVIGQGDPIRYYHNIKKATHVGCSLGHHNFLTPAAPTPVAPTSPGQFECYTCHDKFDSMPDLMDHKKTAHPAGVASAALAPPAPTAVAAPAPAPVVYPIPEPGYYMANVLVNGEIMMRFYRVTKKRNSDIKRFVRQSGDNWINWIEPTERRMAAALICAAPTLAMEAYGKLLGVCGCCGRSLTDPESRARGIGPECIKKFPGRYA